MTTWQFSALAVVTLLIANGAAAQPALPRTPDSSRTDPSRSVTLSLTEYNRLVDLASRPAAPVLIPPVPAVVASAEVRVRVDREAASGTFVLAGDVLRPGVARVNLLAGATVTDATVDGKPLPLVSDNNMHAALLPGPGSFAVSLAWGSPLTYAPGRASFVLPVPAAGTARATIDLPGDQADLHVSAGIVTKRVAVNGRTTVDVTLRPNTPTEVWWTMRDSAPMAAAREVRMLADVFTLVTIGDSDVRMASLVDATVLQGEPRTIALRLPSGYELTAIAGPAIETSEPRDGGVVLTVTEPTARRLQFLVTLERTHAGGSFRADTDFITVPDMQRERGEIAIEGVGTLELDTAERTGMHRIDVRELNPSLQSLARLPLQAAYRYQRTPGSQVALSMNVERFPDAAVLAAVADRATATTLITSEGRALTEVSLQLRNRAQPFLKVAMPPGATIVSVEVAGQPAKPVVGSDGTRVPLLRPGFRPDGAYTVSYVYMLAGVPFDRKGDLSMALPKMDIPVGIVEWEMFVPDRYKATVVGGNVIERAVADTAKSASAPVRFAGGVLSITSGMLPGQIQARVSDQLGVPLPGATVVLRFGNTERAGVTDADGKVLLSGIASGTVSATAQLAGFTSQTFTFGFDQQPKRVDFVLSIGRVAETTTVTAQSPRVNVQRVRAKDDAANNEPSMNVLNLQRRAVGVLPIRIDVPRAGTSHRFVKPLVVDQEATVTLRYKRR